MNVSVEFVASFRDLPEGLWETCFPVPLEGRFWYRTLESCGLEDQFRFSYALLKSGDRPVGIAPCFLHDVPMSLVAPPVMAFFLNLLSKVIPGVGYQRTLFIGSPCSEEGTIGLVPGVQLNDVLEVLAAALRVKAREAGASMIVFKDFREADRAALESLTVEGFFPMVSYPSTQLALPGPAGEGYWKALSPMKRHNFRKKLRRSKEALVLETSFIKAPSDAELTEIFALFQQTYEKGKTKFEKLSIEFFQRIRQEAPAWFILQRDPKSGSLMAFMLVFCLGKRVVNKFIGLDYHRPDSTFLYFRLFEAALDFVYEHAADELQSGQTGYRAKLDLGHQLVPLINLCRHVKPGVNALYRKVARGITWKTLDSDLALFLKAHPEREFTLSESKK